MQSKRLFEGGSLYGIPGLYPFTPENLLRVGLALCLYLKINRGTEKPTMVVENLDFLTLSLSAGFMAGGGDVCVGCEKGDIRARTEGKAQKVSLLIEGLQEHELKMIESILFSRYNMPKAEGERIGRIWIQGKEL